MNTKFLEIVGEKLANETLLGVGAKLRKAMQSEKCEFSYAPFPHFVVKVKDSHILVCGLAHFPNSYRRFEHVETHRHVFCILPKKKRGKPILPKFSEEKTVISWDEFCAGLGGEKPVSVCVNE